ncbi:MAG: hypothetical protein ACOYUZ_02560 [Patescibacteria group bacterium]
MSTELDPQSQQNQPGAPREVAPGQFEIEVDEPGREATAGEQLPTVTQVMERAANIPGQSEAQLARMATAAEAAGVDQSGPRAELAAAQERMMASLREALGDEAEVDQLLAGLEAPKPAQSGEAAPESELPKAQGSTPQENAPVLMSSEPTPLETADTLKSVPESAAAPDVIVEKEQAGFGPQAEMLADYLLQKGISPEKLSQIDKLLTERLGSEYNRLDASNVVKMEGVFLDLNRMMEANASPEEINERVNKFKRDSRRTAFLGGTGPLERQMGILPMLPEKLQKSAEFLKGAAEGGRLEAMVALQEKLGPEKFNYLLSRMSDELTADPSILDKIKDPEYADNLAYSYRLLEGLPPGLSQNETVRDALKGESVKFAADLVKKFGLSETAKVLTVYSEAIQKNPQAVGYLLTPGNFVGIADRVRGMSLGEAVQQRKDLLKLLPEEMR